MQGSWKVLCTLLNGDIVNDMSEPNHCVSSDFYILEVFFISLEWLKATCFKFWWYEVLDLGLITSHKLPLTGPGPAHVTSFQRLRPYHVFGMGEFRHWKLGVQIDHRHIDRGEYWACTQNVFAFLGHMTALNFMMWAVAAITEASCFFKIDVFIFYT